MRYELVGNVAIEATDVMLRRVFAEFPQVVWLARQWGWGDTEVRDQLCAAVEQIAGGASPPER